MADSTITFRYLSELKKKEKDSPELQPIDKDFYNKVAEYVSRKKKMAVQKEQFTSDDESGRTMAMIQTIFNMRESKIIKAAEISAKTGMEIKNMLPEERILFHNLKDSMQENRKRLNEILGGRKLDVELSDVSSDEPVAGDISSSPIEVEDKEPKTEYVQLRILEDIPAFVAENLDTHGPWPKNSEVSCPKMAAEMFVKQGKAERI